MIQYDDFQMSNEIDGMLKEIERIEKIEEIERSGVTSRTKRVLSDQKRKYQNKLDEKVKKFLDVDEEDTIVD